MGEEDEHSPSEFYYPEVLETFDAETETPKARMPHNKQLTNRACWGHTGEYWSSVVAIRTSLRAVRTAITSGQYSPVRPSRSFSKRLIFYVFWSRGINSLVSLLNILRMTSRSTFFWYGWNIKKFDFLAHWRLTLHSWTLLNIRHWQFFQRN